MDLKEQYRQQHAEAIAVAEKLAGSLGPIGGSGKLSPEIGTGGGGVGVGFNSPYITIEVSADAAKPGSREAHIAHQLITEGTTPDKGVAHAVAEVLNAQLAEAQNVNVSRIVRARGNAININLEALSTGLRNNPQLEGLIGNLGTVVQQSALMQLAQAQGAIPQAPHAGHGGHSQQGAARQAPAKKNPIGFSAPQSSGRWGDAVQNERAQSSTQERSR